MEKNKSQQKPASQRRKKIAFIDKSFQLRFIVRFCLMTAVTGAVTMGCIYFFSSKATTVAIVDSRVVVRTMADFLVPLLLQTFIFVTIIMSIFTIIVTLAVSHKIAGPIYRFKRVLQALEGGDFSSDFKLRKFDQLQEMAGAFNSMISKTRDELRILKKDFISLKEKIDGFSGNDVMEHKRVYLHELKTITEQLNRIMNNFKT